MLHQDWQHDSAWAADEAGTPRSGCERAFGRRTPRSREEEIQRTGGHQTSHITDWGWNERPRTAALDERAARTPAWVARHTSQRAGSECGHTMREGAGVAATLAESDAAPEAPLRMPTEREPAPFYRDDQPVCAAESEPRSGRHHGAPPSARGGALFAFSEQGGDDESLHAHRRKAVPAPGSSERGRTPWAVEYGEVPARPRRAAAPPPPALEEELAGASEVADFLGQLSLAVSERAERPGETPAETLAALFGRYDGARDGSVSAADFLHQLRQIGVLAHPRVVPPLPKLDRFLLRSFLRNGDFELGLALSSLITSDNGRRLPDERVSMPCGGEKGAY